LDAAFRLVSPGLRGEIIKIAPAQARSASPSRFRQSSKPCSFSPLGDAIDDPRQLAKNAGRQALRDLNPPVEPSRHGGDFRIDVVQKFLKFGSSRRSHRLELPFRVSPGFD
jgi:hypothetical protein